MSVSSKDRLLSVCNGRSYGTATTYTVNTEGFTVRSAGSEKSEFNGQQGSKFASRSKRNDKHATDNTNFDNRQYPQHAKSN